MEVVMLVACDVWFPVGVAVWVETLLVVAGWVAAPVPVSVPAPELVVAVPWPVPVPVPVPVARLVGLFVRDSVWVAVALWVREALLTLVMESVRTPVDVLVELVAMDVPVRVAEPLPVPLPVLLRVATLVVVVVSGAVTVEVPLAPIQTLAVLQA